LTALVPPISRVNPIEKENSNKRENKEQLKGLTTHKATLISRRAAKIGIVHFSAIQERIPAACRRVQSEVLGAGTADPRGKGLARENVVRCKQSGNSL